MRQKQQKMGNKQQKTKKRSLPSSAAPSATPPPFKEQKTDPLDSSGSSSSYDLNSLDSSSSSSSSGFGSSSSFTFSNSFCSSNSSGFNSSSSSSFLWGSNSGSPSSFIFSDSLGSSSSNDFNSFYSSSFSSSSGFGSSGSFTFSNSFCSSNSSGFNSSSLSSFDQGLNPNSLLNSTVQNPIKRDSKEIVNLKKIVQKEIRFFIEEEEVEEEEKIGEFFDFIKKMDKCENTSIETLLEILGINLNEGVITENALFLKLIRGNDYDIFNHFLRAVIEKSDFHTRLLEIYLSNKGAKISLDDIARLLLLNFFPVDDVISDLDVPKEIVELLINRLKTEHPEQRKKFFIAVLSVICEFASQNNSYFFVAVANSDPSMFAEAFSNDADKLAAAGQLDNFKKIYQAIPKDTLQSIFIEAFFRLTYDPNRALPILQYLMTDKNAVHWILYFLNHSHQTMPLDADHWNNFLNHFSQDIKTFKLDNQSTTLLLNAIFKHVDTIDFVLPIMQIWVNNSESGFNQAFIDLLKQKSLWGGGSRLLKLISKFNINQEILSRLNNEIVTLLKNTNVTDEKKQALLNLFKNMIYLITEKETIGYFKITPSDFYNKIFKPVWSNRTLLSYDKNNNSDIFLNVFAFLIRYFSDNKISISPWELYPNLGEMEKVCGVFLYFIDLLVNDTSKSTDEIVSILDEVTPLEVAVSIVPLFQKPEAIVASLKSASTLSESQKKNLINRYEVVGSFLTKVSSKTDQSNVTSNANSSSSNSQWTPSFTANMSGSTSTTSASSESKLVPSTKMDLS